MVSEPRIIVLETFARDKDMTISYERAGLAADGLKLYTFSRKCLRHGRPYARDSLSYSQRCSLFPDDGRTMSRPDVELLVMRRKSLEMLLPLLSRGAVA